MALILCPECGKQFSDKAAACPSCGCPTSAIIGTAVSQSGSAAEAQMLSLVDQTLEALRKAETDYHIDSARAENFVNRTQVNLNSSSAQKTLSEIVDRTETANARFFERSQALIPVLDGGCRPLLASNPGAKAIKAVAGTIKLINEKSKITKDYSVSFNGTDLGKAARSSYSPLPSSLAVQGFWESAFAGQPDRAEAERFWSDKRAEYDRAMGNKTQFQYAAEGERADILAWMEPGFRYTSRDIAEGVPSLVEINCSISRASSLLSQLVNAGQVEAVREERQTYYCLVTGTPEEREEKRRQREKAENERKAREAEERRKREEAAQEKEKQRKERQAAYDRAMADWKAKRNEVEARREKERLQRLPQLERAEKAAIEKKYQARKKTAEKNLEQMQKKEKQAQEALNALGSFQFSERQEQKELLKSARAGAAEARSELAAAEKAYSEALAALPEGVERRKNDLTRELEKRYPTPKEPNRDEYFPEEREQAEQRRKEEARKAEAERRKKEQEEQEEARRKEEEKKREAANQKASIRQTIAIILTVVGSIVFLIGLINGCQGGRDTSGWLPVIFGGFFAALFGIKMLKGDI